MYCQHAVVNTQQYQRSKVSGGNPRVNGVNVTNHTHWLPCTDMHTWSVQCACVCKHNILHLAHTPTQALPDHGLTPYLDGHHEGQCPVNVQSIVASVQASHHTCARLTGKSVWAEGIGRLALPWALQGNYTTGQMLISPWNSGGSWGLCQQAANKGASPLRTRHLLKLLINTLFKFFLHGDFLKQNTVLMTTR